jgi:hypothetical protein
LVLEVNAMPRVDNQYVPTERLGLTNKFLVSRICKKIFGATRIKAQAREEDLGLCPAQIG